MHIVTAKQMQQLDRTTIEQIGIPGAVLMENAGRGTAEHIMHAYPDALRRGVVVLCGRGNNGGDGFVVARWLHNAGVRVTALLFSDQKRLQGDARLNFDVYRAIGGRLIEVPGGDQWPLIGSDMAHAGLFVDALLGTGLASEVAGLYRRVIETLNGMSHAPVVAVDIPSGIDATTGRVLGCAVRAACTCTYGLPKYGHILYPGALHAGTLKVIDIGIPAQVIADAQLPGVLQSAPDFAGVLPKRAPDAHKGSCGHVLLVAGSTGKSGAALMSAQAAMLSGAGLVTLAAPAGLHDVLVARLSEVMSAPLADSDGCLSPASLEHVLALCKGKTVLGIGPGISDDESVAALVHGVVSAARLPLVIDADGLNAVARDPAVLAKAAGPVIVTPHPGEMARLAGIATDAVQRDRIGTACAFAGRFGVIVVLKGAGTVIAEPGGRHWINTTGNPGMASGGMGDALTGMIAGLLAQGLDPLQAARFAVMLHGAIGDGIAAERGAAQILASEIIARIPEHLARFVKE